MSNPTGPASPFDHSDRVEEPPVGTVLAYQRLGAQGVTLDYVSVRAGDGKWYTSGGRPQQGIGWDEFVAALRHNAYGPVRYATAWQELDLPARALLQGSPLGPLPYVPPTGGSNPFDFEPLVRGIERRVVRDRPQA